VKNLEQMSQAEIAGLFRVDRTTVSAWGRAGMPYKPSGRGSESGYNPSIVIYWRVWQDLRREFRLKDCEPVKALAVALVFAADQDHTERFNRKNFRDQFPKLVADFFDKAEIASAIAYAEGVADTKFRNRG
jgi:phage terminase Nu1 subunit (DNA packaging protein)